MEFFHPVEDIIDSLKAVGAESLDSWDEDIAREIAEHFTRFAAEVLAPINASGDIEGCRFEGGRVYFPAGFKEAYAQLVEGGWQGLNMPEEYGGQGMSELYQGIIAEIFSGANHALQMATGLMPGAARVLLKFGTQGQIDHFVPRMASGQLLTTMCLTEPNAGSDLGAIRTKAVKAGEAWEITGEKIFISNGDQDLSQEISHLVLARSSDDGIKGLSLFMVEGRVNVTRIEEKMGLHASPTCQISFDAQKAQLIGKEGQGLLAMFTMMNHARIDVAFQGVAHATRATHIARHYAAERVQGGVPLDQHADVQRMINHADYLAQSARRMTHLALVELDKAENDALVEFLTPLVKVYATEAGIRAAETATQVLGGYGYLQEYGTDQIYRDARITLIYEGANGIHAKTLATRAFKTGAVAAFDAWLEAAGADTEIWRAAKAVVESSPDPLSIATDFLWVAAHTLANALMPNTRAAVLARTNLDLMK